MNCLWDSIIPQTLFSLFLSSACQIREGAADRRKKYGTAATLSPSASEKDSQSITSASVESTLEGTVSATTLEQTVSEGDESTRIRTGILPHGVDEGNGHTKIRTVDIKQEPDEDSRHTMESDEMIIKPKMSLVREPYDKPIILPVNDLDAQDRELYLGYFVPPNSTTKKGDDRTKHVRASYELPPPEPISHHASEQHCHWHGDHRRSTNNHYYYHHHEHRPWYGGHMTQDPYYDLDNQSPNIPGYTGRFESV
jgi:hypothetical protein